MDTDTRLANVAWDALLRASATLSREFEGAGEWEELTPREYGVLYALSKSREGLRISDLAHDALLTQPGISRLIVRLEQRGLVERHDDARDARVCRIRLTADGRVLRARVGRAHARQVTEAMTRALDRTQLAALVDIGQALTAVSEAAQTNTHSRSRSHE